MNSYMSFVENSLYEISLKKQKKTKTEQSKIFYFNDIRL